MKDSGQPCSDKAVKEMIKAADKDNDGNVNYEGIIIFHLYFKKS